MGSDNVLEATVVLMNGTVVTTNSCSHPELFYAIRGGGGGTYGIPDAKDHYLVVTRHASGPRTGG